MHEFLFVTKIHKSDHADDHGNDGLLIIYDHLHAQSCHHETFHDPYQIPPCDQCRKESGPIRQPKAL